MLLLDRLGFRPAMTLRLAGLAALILWQMRADTPAGLSGRHLAITLMLAGASVGWIVWSWRGLQGKVGPGDGRAPGWELLLMATCGGLLVGPSDSGPSNVFVFVAAFWAGASFGLPRALFVTTAAIVALCVSWILYDGSGIGALAYTLGLLATTFGGAQRYESVVRREQAELLLAQTQRSHEEALRAAKLDESTRIAREIHDVLAHSLAGLTMQLEATAALLENGAEADIVLPRVRRAYQLAREGLRETRLAVGALREDGAPVVPAASRVEALISDFRAFGSPIELTLDGAREQLTGCAGDAAVRIIQEALTNVAKHAPDASVKVEITAGPPLRLTVQNRVPAEVAASRSSLSDTGGGYGIAGMRERAEELGGSLAAGPTPDGWIVVAVLGANEG